jgi:hypothetical protein
MGGQNETIGPLPTPSKLAVADGACPLGSTNVTEPPRRPGLCGGKVTPTVQPSSAAKLARLSQSLALNSKGAGFGPSGNSYWSSIRGGGRSTSPVFHQRKDRGSSRLCRSRLHPAKVIARRIDRPACNRTMCWGGKQSTTRTTATKPVHAGLLEIFTAEDLTRQTEPRSQ